MEGERKGGREEGRERGRDTERGKSDKLIHKRHPMPIHPPNIA